jgi:alkanesulfonate monooxygenase SsuD/methylene tetrahydromethanopterin reductase-like flavin-dependent oxidoreductase (luciferase family)
MKIGISVTSAFPGGNGEERQGAQNMIARARAAHAAGFDSLFLGDHHATPFPYYQNIPMLGRMLAEWRSGPAGAAGTAGALFLLPLWNPVLVAEQTATLACIAEGPFVMQCGLGGDERQFAGMGADIRYRPSAFEQSLSTIRRLWAGETVDMDGRWRLAGSRISPLPPDPIAVWIGASAPVAIDRAARMGDAWLADPGMDLAAAAQRMGVYREACDRYEQRPKCVPIRRDVYVGATPDEAGATMAPYIEKGYRGISAEALVIGDVAGAVEYFADLAELGYTDVIVRNITADQSQALATIERLGEVARQVAPL